MHWIVLFVVTIAVNVRNMKPVLNYTCFIFVYLTHISLPLCNFDTFSAVDNLWSMVESFQ